jgi:hypothetical protein
LLVTFLGILISAVLTAVKEYSVTLSGIRVQVWVILATVAALVGAAMIAAYIHDRFAKGRFWVKVIKPREGMGVFLEKTEWITHDGLLWKVVFNLNSRSVVASDGPFCPNCKTGMIIKSEGGLLNTDIGSVDYWKCPNCRKKVKASKDEDEQRDEVEKIVQGRIDRGEY